MFNRGAFNRMGFNRPYEVVIYASAAMDGVGGMAAAGTMEYYAAVFLDGVGGLTAEAIRERYGSAVMDGLGELTAVILRDIPGAAQLDGVGGLTVNASRFHVDSITIEGSFAPGDRIVIDGKNLTITHNGVNALHEMEGDFFDLVLGNNVIKYTDTAGSRSVLVRVTHRDKFI